MPRPFLTAQWRHLINLTYAVPPDLLLPHLPKGLELDSYNGQAHVSFVAFQFLDTRVLGMRIPLHVNFPEVNLRFYVRHQGQVGVVFIREYVPSPATALIAQLSYNEPYLPTPMRSRVQQTDDALHVHYALGRGLHSSVTVVADLAPHDAATQGAEHHFKEHDLGFGRTRSGRTLQYRVEHPIWQVHAIRSIENHIDFARLYGPAWAFLTQRQPDYVLLAQGSAVAVHRPTYL